MTGMGLLVLVAPLCIISSSFFMFVRFCAIFLSQRCLHWRFFTNAKPANGQNRFTRKRQAQKNWLKVVSAEIRIT